MGERIKQLEDAVSILQAGISSERHPLLRPELLGIKFGVTATRSNVQSAPVAHTDLTDSLGTLTIGEHGSAKYFGRSAGTEVCLQSWFYVAMTYIRPRFYYRYAMLTLRRLNLLS